MDATAAFRRTSPPSRRPTDTEARYRREEPDWATRFAAHVDEAIGALGERDIRPAAMVVDSGFTSDGILTPPPAYLQDAVRRWRDAGGLFVADEVQSGFGRPGSHLWGFDVHGVVPDIVTLGKPMGNGHPVAAVITRADIVDRFALETEWFSTFGGNPVACEASLAVLDVIEQERLQRNAAGAGRVDPRRAGGAHVPSRADRRRALARSADRRRARARP